MTAEADEVDKMLEEQVMITLPIVASISQFTWLEDDLAMRADDLNGSCEGPEEEGSLAVYYVDDLTVHDAENMVTDAFAKHEVKGFTFAVHGNKVEITRT